jgi:SAM-dependent methyltransferase
MNGRCASGTGNAVGLPTAAEREVADLLALEADPLRRGPSWTVCPSGFTPLRSTGRPACTRRAWRAITATVSLPACFDGLRVLDVGTFDGSYAFLAIDNEQYRLWVRARWGVDLAGGEGFQTIHRLLGSTVEYRRLDAFELHRLDERFDFIYCFGILHRVDSPLGLVRLLRDRLAPGGRVLVETYGSVAPQDGPVIRVCEPGEVYTGDDHVYWSFSSQGLAYLAALAGYECAEVVDPPVVDGPCVRRQNARPRSAGRSWRRFAAKSKKAR